MYIWACRINDMFGKINILSRQSSTSIINYYVVFIIPDSDKGVSSIVSLLRYRHKQYYAQFDPKFAIIYHLLSPEIDQASIAVVYG